jgi:hypothetical protein
MVSFLPRQAMAYHIPLQPIPALTQNLDHSQKTRAPLYS